MDVCSQLCCEEMNAMMRDFLLEFVAEAFKGGRSAYQLPSIIDDDVSRFWTLMNELRSTVR